MKSLSESTAPFFLAYGADPNVAEPKTHLLDKEALAAHLDPREFASGFENGQIICAVVPIDYKYSSLDDGCPVTGQVSQESLLDLMKMKSDIALGKTPSVRKDKKKAPAEDLPNYLTLEQLKELLVEKGYDTRGTQGWDAEALTYYVVDPTGSMKGTRDGLYPIRPVNNPIWGKEEAYVPKFCTAQVMSLPECELTSGMPL